MNSPPLAGHHDPSLSLRTDGLSLELLEVTTQLSMELLPALPPSEEAPQLSVELLPELPLSEEVPTPLPPLLR